MGRVRQARRDDHDRGALAVEFALLFPLLFALLFGTLVIGWRVWEAQAAQSAARQAARIAGLGLTDLGSYGRAVTCLGERNGLRAGSVSDVTISFFDQSFTEPAQAAVGGYVKVTMTYRSALGGLPFGGDGLITASGISRVEQPGSPTLLTDQVLALGGELCR